MALLRCILGVVVLLSASFLAKSERLEEEFGAGKEKENLDLDVDSGGIRHEENVVEDLSLSEDDPILPEDDPILSEEDPNEPEKDLNESVEDDDNLSVSERLEQVNKNLERDGDSLLEDGDIAVFKSHLEDGDIAAFKSHLEDGDIAAFKSHVHKRNADQCVTKGCKWPRSRNGKVYVPYVITSQYSSSQRDKIKETFRSFSEATCIRFIPRRSHQNYLYILSSNGCWSYIGRQGKAQKLSLKSSGCMHKGTIQHELLHALGFNHEQKRSDRDHYIKVNWQNIHKGMEHNFKKVETLNQQTPYDYGSVMHYSRTAFSTNGKPTLEARNRRSEFGKAKEMSLCDIQRVNRLYCQ